MTRVLASIRPDSWNFPLFLHVLGAMVLVGAVTAAAVAQLGADGPVVRGAPATILVPHAPVRRRCPPTS